jgi:hypothetical protein
MFEGWAKLCSRVGTPLRAPTKSITNLFGSVAQYFLYTVKDFLIDEGLVRVGLANIHVVQWNLVQLSNVRICK